MVPKSYKTGWCPICKKFVGINKLCDGNHEEYIACVGNVEICREYTRQE